jgi:hypothetical protein
MEKSNKNVSEAQSDARSQGEASTTDYETGTDTDQGGFTPGRTRRPGDRKFRKRTQKRDRETSGSGLTPTAKEQKKDAHMPRFATKFDEDGNLVKPTEAQEAATKRARDDRASRFIANARSHRPSGGDGRGGGDLDGRSDVRGRGQGRGRGRGNDRNSSDTSRNGKFNSHYLPSSGIAQSSSGSGADQGGVRFSDSGPKAKKINDHSKPGANASAAPSAKDNDINKDETLTNSFSVPKAPHPPSAFKTNNPTFAALMAKRWARPEEVVYVFSSQTEQLELTKTQLGPSCVKPRPD